MKINDCECNFSLPFWSLKLFLFSRPCPRSIYPLSTLRQRHSLNSMLMDGNDETTRKSSSFRTTADAEVNLQTPRKNAILSWPLTPQMSSYMGPSSFDPFHHGSQDHTLYQDGTPLVYYQPWWHEQLAGKSFVHPTQDQIYHTSFPSCGNFPLFP